MPVEIERPTYPRNQLSHRGISTAANGRVRTGLRIALVNNMPDAALADTEEQFLALLRSAAGEQPVRLARHYLPSVPRSPETRERLAREYFGLTELFDRGYDGVIVTGAEPVQPDLRSEPYWPELTAVMDWAADNTHSAVWSCLAAHAAVLHLSGIRRQPLAAKRIGVFAERVAAQHPLTRGAQSVIQIPHSRWNELAQPELATEGYQVLTHSPSAGTGMFVAMRGDSLFVHLQGHPEYQAETLFKEYRRDVRRFLHGQRPDYPSLPRNYFDVESERALEAFRRRALAQADPALMSGFPDDTVAARLRRPWASDAVLLYRNWLDYLAVHPTVSATSVHAANV